MKRVIVQKNYNQMNLSEISQATGIRMAVVNRVDRDTYSQCMAYVKCRDFFNEAILAPYSGKDYKIYGFSSKGVRFDEKESSLVFKFVDKKQAGNFIKNFPAFRTQIRSLGIKWTTIMATDDPLVFVIKGDRLWGKQVALMSLYSLIIRWVPYVSDWSDWSTVCSDMMKTDLSPDVDYAEGLKDKPVYDLITLNNKVFDKSPLSEWNKDTTTSQCHDGGGIMTFFHENGGQTPMNESYYKKFMELYS